jgi:protein-disulfide isomerase
MSSRKEDKEQVRAEREARARTAEQAERRRRLLVQLGAVLGVAAVVVVVLVLISQGGKDEPTAAGGAAVTGVADSRAMLAGLAQDGTSLGDPDAPVVLTEFADPQCPFCREYAVQVLPQIIERYVRPGRLRLELRLLRFLGPDSDRLARVAAAASTENRMWQFVGLAYQRQGAENSGYATDEFINSLVADAGLGSLDAGAKADQIIRRGENAARTAGIESTPSFLIGPTGGPLERFQPSDLTPDAFVPRIQEELGK